MATKKAAKKKVLRVARMTTRTVLRPRTVRREMLVLSHADPAGLSELVSQQLARSVEPPWDSKEPASGVEVELCSAIHLCAPSNMYAVALELSHWEMQERPRRRLRRC
jgi:hypothetical protein